MFGDVDNGGNPNDAEDARVRSNWEPRIEIMQIKGNSEVNWNLWSADEFADFGNADRSTHDSGRTLEKQDSTVKKGLDYGSKLGVNPCQLGFVAGTDSHNGTPSDALHDNDIGGHGGADGTIERRRGKDIGGWIMGKDSNVGLTGNPVFTMHAMKDPDGANLGRIQIIRGGSTIRANQRKRSSTWCGVVWCGVVG